MVPPNGDSRRGAIGIHVDPLAVAGDVGELGDLRPA